MHLAEELILKKRDGVELSGSEIVHFVEGISSHAISDAQIAAFAMATWFRGMSLGEQMNLTLAMRDSGDVLDWPDLGGPVLDKHSTGGVGDVVSLILGPLVAACGAFVPMISGRGLGHTGGTLDKLESIPGFDTAPGIRQFQQLVRDQGVAIVGQTDKLAPADRRFYAVRDVTATVSSPPLIISSILSKKLAEGLDALVLDIKFGSGAFMENPLEARNLAEEITQVARRAELPCTALITDMNQPLAWSAGNALEVREAIRFLRGDARHERLLSVVLSLSAELLQLGGLAADAEEGRSLAISSLDSGKAAERFARMVVSQGGPAGLLETPDAFLSIAEVVRPVFPECAGFINEMDTRAIGSLVVKLGGGRRRAEDDIDPSVGLSEISSVGQVMDRDSPLAIIHAASESEWEQAAAILKSAVRIVPDKAEVSEVVYHRVQGGRVDD
jgi:thymidine phosphorylase